MPESQADNRPIDVDYRDPYSFMMSVVKEIKEIPELPSETPKDTEGIVKVDFPDEGGVLTYMSNHIHPYRGFPYFEFVEKIDTMKKMGRGVLSSFFHSLKKRNKLEIALLALVPWLFDSMLVGTIYAAHRVVSRFKFKKEKYSQAVREVYRVFDLKNGEIRDMVRDFVCMLLENDNAYRYRFQDIIVELDKEALTKNPSKELCRLLTLMQTRETEKGVTDTWTLGKRFLPMYFFINKKIRKETVELLTNLNMEEVKLSKEDKWFAYPRKDYICGFRQNPNEEEKEQIALYEKKIQKDKARESVREASTIDHQQLFARHRIELPISPELEAKVVQMDNDSRMRVYGKAESEFVSEQMQNRKSVFNEEEMSILERQLGEIREMDTHYNNLLQAI